MEVKKVLPSWVVEGISPKTKSVTIYAFSAEGAAKKWAEKFDAGTEGTYAANKEKITVQVIGNGARWEFDIECYMIPRYDIWKIKKEEVK